jgi:P27 family predicted phage terminase small subunit
VGQRGPAAKPPELKLLEGRGHRPVDLTSTFRPEVGAPSMPRDISREGRKAWKRLVPELVRYNLLSKVDSDALEDLCETIGLIKVLRRSINARQELLLSKSEDPAGAVEARTPKGMRIQSPTYQALNREREKLRSWLAEFGLTPAQRARVTLAVRAQLKLFDVAATDGADKVKDPDFKPAGFADFE